MVVLLTTCGGVAFENSLVSQEFPFFLCRPKFRKCSQDPFTAPYHKQAEFSPQHFILVSQLVIFFRFMHKI